MRSSFVSLIVLLVATAAQAQTNASGLGVNVPLVGRLIGSGNTLFITALDVSNHMTTNRRVDFYLDGATSSGGVPVIARGSISSTGTLVARGTGGSMRRRSNVHFDDFVGSLAETGLVPQTVMTDGFVGSVLFVFDGSPESGVGSVAARFYNSFGGGTVGVSLRGREMTVDEPQSLVSVVLDTRSNQTGAPKTYPNLFVNNVGMTPSGVGTAGAVTIEISALNASSGQAIGTPITVSNLQPGRTAIIGQVLNALQIPIETTAVLVFVRVTSGNAAIQGLISQVDDVTRDGAVFEMPRADF